jgi:RNA polymerase sigma-70 factor (ECF subfamily)
MTDSATMDSGVQAVLFSHRESLLRFLRARGAGEAAEDVLQELWIRVSGFGGPIEDPLAYLYRCANNLMLDRKRAELRSARRDLMWVEATGAGEGAAPDSERSVIAREELRRAEAALAALGERTDAIFRKFRLGGMTQPQIAAELGISLSAVEKHLQKAYRALIELRRRPDAG